MLVKSKAVSLLAVVIIIRQIQIAVVSGVAELCSDQSTFLEAVLEEIK